MHRYREDFYDRHIFTEEEKSPIFLIDSKAVNTMFFRFKKLSVEAGMLKVLPEIGALFEKLFLNSRILLLLSYMLRKRLDSNHN